MELKHTAPAWNDLKADGRVVLDYPARKLAVYPNTAGQVMVVSEVDSAVTCLDIEPDEVPAVIAALQRSMPKARETSVRINADYQTHCALEKAMTGQ